MFARTALPWQWLGATVDAIGNSGEKVFVSQRPALVGGVADALGFGGAHALGAQFAVGRLAGEWRVA